MKTRLWRFPHDVEKTEAWLNELASTGLICVGADTLMSRYTFEQGEPGEYDYRLVFFDKCFGHSKSIRYLSFLRENGIECVGHYFQYVLLRKKVADGAFDLLTDRASQIKYNERIKKEYTIVCVMYLIMLPIFCHGMITGHINVATGIVETSTFIFLLMIMAHIILLINVGLAVSSVKQVRRYALRIKNLKSDSAVFE
ncbi:MAG: DUF2812 domain-containing protein [Defluviitaleaceae bacterium]|nr:DUF2812 domain-containing protein [Defluviitaleaceae bacterium]